MPTFPCRLAGCKEVLHSAKVRKEHERSCDTLIVYKKLLPPPPTCGAILREVGHRMGGPRYPPGHPHYPWGPPGQYRCSKTPAPGQTSCASSCHVYRWKGEYLYGVSSSGQCGYEESIVGSHYCAEHAHLAPAAPAQAPAVVSPATVDVLPAASASFWCSSFWCCRKRRSPSAAPAATSTKPDANDAAATAAPAPAAAPRIRAASSKKEAAVADDVAAAGGVKRRVGKY